MDTRIILKVISSSGEPYDVHFEISDNKFTVLCNCPAGVYGKLCKHKTRLLDGDTSILFNQTDKDTLKQLHDFADKSKYAELMSSYNLLKKEIEIFQKKEKKIKEQVELILKTGIEIL